MFFSIAQYHLTCEKPSMEQGKGFTQPVLNAAEIRDADD